MRKLFIYYSFTGNGDFVAETMQKQGYEIRKVKEKKQMPKSFFWQMMVGGFRAGFGLKGKLVEYDNVVVGYDEIVVGSPIWNGKLPPAVNAIIKDTKLKGKNVSFILYSGSGPSKKKAAIKKLNKLFMNPTIIELQEPKKHVEEMEKLKELRIEY